MAAVSPVAPPAIGSHVDHSYYSANEYRQTLTDNSYRDDTDVNQQITSTRKPERVPRGPVTARLEFYEAPKDGSRPFNYVETPPEGVPQTNFGSVTADVQIRDIRTHESDFTLDRHAFEAISNVQSSVSKDDPIADDGLWSSTANEAIRTKYYPEVEELILGSIPGARKVVIFDHTLRRADPSASRKPVLHVHVDQTASSAIQRVKLHLPTEEADEIISAGTRVRLVNVWRPLNDGPVESFPLAVADAGSVRDQDLVAVQHRYPDRVGETAAVKYNPSQRWWYWSGMLPTDRLLLKCFDSDEAAASTGRAPHTAFEDPRSLPDATPRESIEVRTLVFG